MKRNDYPKVLVGVTTYEGKDYIFDKNYEVLTHLTYPNYDYVIVDNSPTLDYVARLKRRGVKHVFHVDRGANSRMALAKSQNYIREVFLKGSYDYLFMLENDLLPPLNIIERLMQYQKSVTGAVYMIGTSGVKVPCVFFLDKKDNGLMGTRLIGTYEANGQKYWKRGEVDKFLNTGLQQVHGCGMGVTLIRRNVLLDEVFWYDERFDDKHSDVYFYLSLQRKGIPVFVDTNIVVDHYPSKWEHVNDK
jgi:hypothetical protein